MRMTNKIMQNNSLYNINQNKILQDQLSTNMSTLKKLTRPSDDPIVAIRALRLRTSVSEITQYRDKNAKDAEAWLNVTEDALSTAGEIIGGPGGLIREMQKAANKDLTPTDIQILMASIKSLRDEVYATANTDFAGRYIFTGYRTDTPLSFTKDVLNQDISYRITEQLNINSFDTVNYTDMQNVKGLSKANYQATANANITEQDITNHNIWRLRLSYDDLRQYDTADFSTALEDYYVYIADPNADPEEVKRLESALSPRIVFEDSPGSFTDFTAELEEYIMVSTNETPDPHQTIIDMNERGIEGAVFIPETGEILLSDAAYEALKTEVSPATEIRVIYDKNSFKEGDLRPEHYFACVSTEIRPDGSIREIDFNPEYLKGMTNRQIIEYDVGYNQRIRINTLAEDVFTHTLSRNVDDLDLAVRDLLAIQTVVDDLQGILINDPDNENVQKQLDAARKAYDFIRDNVHRMFENSITIMQRALDDNNIAVTDSGTRSARLDLISNRLLSQKTTFEILKSENEDADIAEIAVKLTSAELSYNAALMATGKIMQTSLMNFI